MVGYEGERKTVLVVDCVPVIAVSASATAEGRERVLAAGANAFLTKPFRANQLLAVLEQHLQIRLIRR